MKAKRWVRSLAAFAVTTAITVIAAEVLCGLFYTYDAGEFFWTRERAPASERPPQSPPQRGEFNALNRLSPYYGYMFGPGLTIERVAPEKRLRAIGYTTPPEYATWHFNNFGFLSDRDYPASSDPQDFVVGIFGGSVAFWLAMDGGRAIRENLARLPALAGKNIILLNFASGGYKQPQTNLILNYFLAAGQHFDLIVNLDGFNESFISLENLEQGIHPLMPRVSGVRSVENSLISSEAGYEVAAARYQRAGLEWRMAASKSAVYYYVLHALRDRARAREVAQEKIAAEAAEGRRYAVVLAAETASYEQRLPSIVNAWTIGSLTMDAIAKRAGALYLHILQPNQYFGSRPFVEAEREPLSKELTPMPVEIIRKTYRELIAASARLREQGVDFVDATQVFVGHDETIYYDSCCHFNLHGYSIFVETLLAPAMRRAIEQRK
jgi:hypothetical protein